MFIQMKIIFILFCQIIYVQPESNLLSRFMESCTPSILSMFDYDFDNTTKMELSLVVKFNPTVLKNFKLSNIEQLMNHKSFKKDYKTALYIHGYMDTPQLPLSQFVTQGYDSILGYNVLLYDTKDLEFGLYMRTAKRIPELGKRLGVGLAQLYSAGYDISKLELIGHSLGAHIAGFAGKTFFNITNKKLPIIFALDPAGPCFNGADKDSRVAEEDADFVETIHTNAGFGGIIKPVGTVDIYVNGGRFQPGYGTVGSHLRVLTYWVIAIRSPKKFIAHKCKHISSALIENCQSNETIFVGPEIDRNARGIYLLKIIDSDL